MKNRAIQIFSYVSFVLFALSLVLLFFVRAAHAEVYIAVGTTTCADGFTAITTGRLPVAAKVQQSQGCCAGPEAGAVGIASDVCVPNANTNYNATPDRYGMFFCAVCKRD